MSSNTSHLFELTPNSNQRLNNLCGPCNQHLLLLESYFDVVIRHKSNQFQVIGTTLASKAVSSILTTLYQQANKPISQEDIHHLKTQLKAPTEHIFTRNKQIHAKNAHQASYFTAMSECKLNFAVGPAGTGKTYLAVAKAVEALEQGVVQRLIFVRPAVEAGEKLGFLPGDLVEKVLPYLRPIYDALYEMLGFDEVQKLIGQNIIEIAPLAFMRGRTLNEAFIILDEAQNTTTSQMKMFLTRLGFGSTAIVTGDTTQTDLPRGTLSGLSQALEVAKQIEDTSIIYFSAADVVRDPLVAKIITAYETVEQASTENKPT